MTTSIPAADRQPEESPTRLLGPATTSLADHLDRHGSLPRDSADALLAAVTASELTGRGGAGFPTHRKLAAVRSGAGRRVVIGNGAEGEPASRKDVTLLRHNPHLVLDGLQVAARIVAADRAFLYLHDDPPLVAAARACVTERARHHIDAVPVEVVPAPARFVSGEESAVASRVSGGPPLPTSKPPRVFEAGAFGRPTLVQNVETLAHLAHIARYGVPGEMLFTVSGAVHRPGVVEAPMGTSVEDLVRAAGGLTTHVQAVLLGGYHGTWVGWPQARELPLQPSLLRERGLSVGAGVVLLLPADACSVAEVCRVLDYLATESAGQCGPCVFGLPALARSFGRAAASSRGSAQRRVDELAQSLERRGGCAHPDGTVRFLRSATAVFADHLAEHARGRCTATRVAPVLPVVTAR